MVEQLAPQGWPPVDNIPSLNLVSVFCRASIHVSQPLFLSVSLRSWTSYSPALHTHGYLCPHVRPQLRYQTSQQSQQKSEKQENGNDEKKSVTMRSTMTSFRRPFLIVDERRDRARKGRGGQKTNPDVECLFWRKGEAFLLSWFLFIFSAFAKYA